MALEAPLAQLERLVAASISPQTRGADLRRTKERIEAVVLRLIQQSKWLAASRLGKFVRRYKGRWPKRPVADAVEETRVVVCVPPEKKELPRRGLSARDPNIAPPDRRASLASGSLALVPARAPVVASTAKSRAALAKNEENRRYKGYDVFDGRALEGGWCGAGAVPKWHEVDQKIQKKLKKRRNAGDAAAAAAVTDTVLLLVAPPAEAPQWTPRKAALEAAEKAATRWLAAARQDVKALDRRASLAGPLAPPNVEELEAIVDALQRAKSRGSSPEKAQKARAPCTLAEARAQLRSAMERLLAGDASVEVEVERWDQVVSAHPDYALEQRRERQAWDDGQAHWLGAALRAVRSVVPPDVHGTTAWTSSTLEAAGVPSAVAMRVSASRALWLVRAPANTIAKMHIAVLRAFTTTGFDVVEHRALYAAISSVKFENDADGAKAAWREAVRDKLKSISGQRPNQPNQMWQTLLDADGPFDPDAAADDGDVTPSGVETSADFRMQELKALGAQRRRTTLAMGDMGAFGKRVEKKAPRMETRQKLDKDDPRAAMLAMISLRAPQDSGALEDDPRAAMLAMIARRAPKEAPPQETRPKIDKEDPRAAMLAMLRAPQG
ncbi:hypothetical protein M885DRAFT_618496 [Pelagophyceae sp. CCMP2097]|nr:hypothetical protein M885DRAFT_618496 [Pelagophyceae sp. CCMP2097]